MNEWLASIPRFETGTATAKLSSELQRLNEGPSFLGERTSAHRGVGSRLRGSQAPQPSGLAQRLCHHKRDDGLHTVGGGNAK